MAGKKRGGPLNPEATRTSILEAALSCLAERGPEGVSFSEVARLANVDRGTAHRHFLNREQLLREAVQFVSDKLRRAVFGGEEDLATKRFAATEVMEQNARLIKFAMDNPELCRIWLFDVLTAADPAADPFWQAFAGSYAAFVRTETAQENANSEVLAIIMLSSVFLWSIRARAHSHSDAEREKLAEDLSLECMRLSMYGALKPERYPEIAGFLAATFARKAGG
jgi:AcrR family transcriptional regulator